MGLNRYLKAFVAGGTAALLAAQTAIPMSPTVRGWVTVGIATLGALGVYQVPNAPMPLKLPAGANERLVDR